VIDKVKNDTPFFGIISLRFVKGTSATLGFTKFQNTCVMEIDGVDGKKTKKFYEEVCQLLLKKKIQFTLHWGKNNSFLTKKALSNFYSRSKISTWKKSRDKIFKNDTKVKRMFENEFMKTRGLV